MRQWFSLIVLLSIPTIAAGQQTAPRDLHNVRRDTTIFGDMRLVQGKEFVYLENTSNGSNFVSFVGPASIAADVTWTLPNTDAAGYLTSDGAGLLSWSAVSGGIDHGSLGGLDDDDHPGAFWLAGRAGGQTGYGGTAASEVLTLGGTAHATVGHVRLGAGTYYADLDETIGRLTLHYDATDTVGGLYLESELSAGDRAARIQAAHRSSATPITMVIGTSLAATTEMEWGGGSAAENAVTHHRFYAAGNITTVTGTEMMRLDLGGLVIDANGVSGDAASLLEIRGATTPAAQVTWETTSSYGQLNFYESGTKRGGVQAIGSAFATAARRNDLEILTSTAGGRISFLPGAAGHMATIDATGMAVGLASTVDPRVKFEVALDANTLPAMSGDTAIVASNASATGDSANITIIAGATGTSNLFFGDTADEDAGTVKFDHSTDDFYVNIGATNMVMVSSAGMAVGSGGVVPAYMLDIVENPATTNSVHDLLRFARTTSGTAADGIGVAQITLMEDSGGTARLTGRAFYELTDADVATGIDCDFGIQLMSGTTAAATKMRLSRLGLLGVGANITPTEGFDTDDNSIRIRTSRTPASASAACSGGEIAWDSSYIYVCTATNTWVRTALSTW